MTTTRSLTIDEAAFALERGFRIRHSSYTEEEWTEASGSKVVFEDGCTQDLSYFWDMRGASCWKKGWSIVDRAGIEGVSQEHALYVANLDAPASPWIYVDSYKDVPVGLWQVALEPWSGRTEGAKASLGDFRSTKDFAYINGHPAEGGRKVYAYMPAPILPEMK